MARSLPFDYQSGESSPRQRDASSNSFSTCPRISSASAPSPASTSRKGAGKELKNQHCRRRRERKYWQDHMKAYEGYLGATSSSESPWYVVPADDKENARLIVSQIVLAPWKAQDVIYANDRGTPERAARDPREPGEVESTTPSLTGCSDK
jgi:hypothetical protein